MNEEDIKMQQGNVLMRVFVLELLIYYSIIGHFILSDNMIKEKCMQPRKVSVGAIYLWRKVRAYTEQILALV
jgi:regulator of sigma D